MHNNHVVSNNNNRNWLQKYKNISKQNHNRVKIRQNGSEFA